MGVELVRLPGVLDLREADVYALATALGVTRYMTLTLHIHARGEGTHEVDVLAQRFLARGLREKKNGMFVRPSSRVVFDTGRIFENVA